MVYAPGRPSVSGSNGDSPDAPEVVRSATPKPGELGIKERRSWKTWQLAVAVVVALLIGMVIGNSGGSSTPKPVTPGYKPPPPAASGSGATTTAPEGSSTTAAASASSAPSSTPPSSGDASATSAASAPPAASSGATQVLLPEHDATGAWTSPPFTVGAGPWNIGWAYRCSGAATPAPVFEVFVVLTGGTPGSTPAVSGSASQGSSVSAQTTTGSQQLVVRAPSSCAWAVKATGIP